MNNSRRGFAFLLSAVLLVAGGTALTAGRAGMQAGMQQISGTVRIDGSSTVFPITEAVAEEFQLENPRARVLVGVSGTGGGFERFLVGETDMNNASRLIKQSEVDRARMNGVDYVEIPVAFDGISVVVNQANYWVDYLTVEELKMIWEPGSDVTFWSDVRPEWPDEEIHLYGPGPASGTFDYFTEAVVGEEDAVRPDFTASEDDNVLVRGIAGDPYALGYFGYAYYAENVDQLKVVPVDSGNGPVKPTPETIGDGTYTPLSRPLLLYVAESSLQRPEVQAFVEFYLTKGPGLIPYVGYVPLPEAEYEKALTKVRR